MANPRPAAVWIGVAAVLFALQAGALTQFLTALVVDAVAAVPGVVIRMTRSAVPTGSPSSERS